MKTPIKSDKVVCVDCDDTLVMWDLSKYPSLRMVEVDCWGKVILKVNQKNCNLVRKLARLGYSIIVWSQTGWDWAEKVSEAVGIADCVTLYLTKPRYHVDDLPASAWMGERIWRDPVTGEPKTHNLED